MSLAGETPYEAYNNFREPLQRALSCINKEAHVWALGGSNGYSPGQEHALVPNRGEPVKLLGARVISLTAFFAYRIENVEGVHGPWRATTTAYFHTLEGSNHQEIIAYHWHPTQGSASNFPHLHIGRGIGADLGEIHKYHIPTGRIALEDVLRLAINEFGVEARRTDWREVIDETQAAFERGRTWP